MRIVTTPGGLKSIEISDKGRTIRLHSFFEPEKEAKRAVEQFSSNEGRLILVCGLGLGWHIKALRERFPERKIAVIERLPAIVDACREHCPDNIDATPLLLNEDDIEQYLQNEDIGAFRGFDIFFHRQSYTLDAEFYDSLIRDFAKGLSSRISDLLTRCEFEERWVLNTVCNIPSLFSGVPVKDFFGTFRGYTGILVSAGPSLRENASLLAQAKDCALIVCVDTAYKVLCKLGIRPHMVMVLDAQKHSRLHFLGVAHDVPLIADLVSSPLVLRSWETPPIISTTAKYYEDTDGRSRRETTPFIDFVERHTETPGDIQSGGSVATSLFDFLLNAGCSQIVLVGQDLAYTGREIHSSGTYHNDRWIRICDRFNSLDSINQAIIRKRRIRHVQSVRGKTVVSDFVLDLYRQWFEDSASRVPVKVLNASADGARIHNTTERSLQQVINSLDTNVKKPEELINAVFSKRKVRNNQDMVEALTNLVNTGKALPAMSDGDALKIADKAEFAGVFDPFVKKSRMFALRNTMNADKCSEMLAHEIKRAGLLVAQYAERSLKVLKNNE